MPETRSRVTEGEQIWVENSTTSAPLTNSVVVSVLTSDCWWEDETARERPIILPSNAETKKMNSLTPHNQGYLRASFRD